MDIVFNIDNKYVPFLCTTILSLLENNKEHKIKFHILTIELSNENREYIKELVTTQNSEVLFYDINIDLLKGFPIGKGTVNPNYPYTGYLRLLISEIIPSYINKILYLDCDIIIINSIDKLWNTDISNYCIAAVDDYGENGTNGIERLIGIKGYSYFNAGVLLMNLDRMRELGIYEQYKEWSISNYSKIKFHDQDVLNALLFDKRKKIDSQWNHMTNFGNGTIIHFSGIKPWQSECKHPLKKVFTNYLQRTKWGNMKLPIHQKKNNFFKTIYILLKQKIKSFL